MTMTIRGKIGDRHILQCDRCDETFAPRRIGLAVACPHCGHTGTPPTTKMMADYLLQQVAPAARDAMVGV